MAFPNDLSDVVVFKIHPAIGIARLSRNDDYYVFGKDPGTYKSNGLMKRQAVQFRIYAYGENHAGLGELTPKVMGALKIQAVWSAKVANRKIAHQRKIPLSSTDFVISAQASSDDASGGKLVGSLPGFDEGKEIPMGQITSDGRFIPPIARAFRKTKGQEIPGMYSNEIADNASDGSVTVKLTVGGQMPDVLPACIVVAPQDFSPDTSESKSLIEFFEERLQIPDNLPPGNLHNQAARALDEAALESTTQIFEPGMETSFGSAGPGTEVIDIKSVFYLNSQDPKVDPREARVRYKASLTDTGAGAVPGQLTSGLCSPWQGDFAACVGYWAQHLPQTAYLDEETSTLVQFFRKQYADTSDNGPTLEYDPNGMDRHVDKIGVMRIRSGKRVETERDKGDDIKDLIA
jgi:hypothetical protein